MALTHLDPLGVPLVVVRSDLRRTLAAIGLVPVRTRAVNAKFVDGQDASAAPFTWRANFGASSSSMMLMRTSECSNKSYTIGGN